MLEKRREQNDISDAKIEYTDIKVNSPLLPSRFIGIDIHDVLSLFRHPLTTLVAHFMTVLPWSDKRQ